MQRAEVKSRVRRGGGETHRLADLLLTLNVAREGITQSKKHKLHVLRKFFSVFLQPSPVFLLARGIDADGSAHTRVNTWIDDASEEGFRLHATSWETSRLWTLRLGPASFEFTVEHR